MANDQKHGSVGGYILVALILGVITYFEFAIVEYPQAWLGTTMTFVTLAVLSVIKFVMVVMFFMHLKGDDRMYSGFFSSGMVIAVASFIAMTAMFLLPRAMSFARTEASLTQAEGEAGGHAEAELDQELVDLIESNGRSRAAAARADTPTPTDRGVSVEAPRAANDASTYEVQGAGGGELAGPEVAEAAAGEEAGAADAAADAADDAASDEQAADDEEQPQEAADAAAPVEWDRAQGEQVYNSTCSGCHQPAGQGIPGAFPPLANHAAEVYAAGGEEFLAQVVLYGMQGPIQVAGMTYNGLMPAWGSSLDDAAIANVLNHIIAGLGDGAADGFTPYTAEDIAAHRGDELTATEVHDIRAQLGL
ncbi:MAG TPA: c-type cytochrome [Trueperaceae bacterium]|nr:c-type cytochrome [Trueperaceae bacterium]